MSLHLYDSATRSLRPFEPLEVGKASIYLCGATVQGAPHIGHVRSEINFDILWRWLAHRGFQVTFVRNVTDIDDKILKKAAEAGRPWWAWAATYEREFSWAYDVLGCQPPTYEPRATGHITEMVELMQRLIDDGHAYPADGDVYFDVRSYPAYGSLSGQNIDAMLPAGDSEGDARKRDPRDFALWKGHKDGEPLTASWPTPWGRGRPGWHLECSAMATKYLGPAFDIHGGGLDLIFPHHENELAQSVAAGDGFARYWMHNAWVTTGGEKMSKSLGNTLLVSEMVKRWRPVELRYYLGAAHYRSHIEYSEGALSDAASAYRRIENVVNASVDKLGTAKSATDLLAEFVTAMDQDLGVPAAIAVLHHAVRACNIALGLGDLDGLSVWLPQVLGMSDVLGVNPLRWQNEGNQIESADSDLSILVDHGISLHARRTAQALALGRELTDQRERARYRKDFSEADRIRNLLTENGFRLIDTPSGTELTIEDQ